MEAHPLITFQVPKGGTLEQELEQAALSSVGGEAEAIAFATIPFDESGQIDVGSTGVLVMLLPSFADLARQRDEIIQTLTSAAEGADGPLYIDVASGAGIGGESVRAALDAAAIVDSDVIVAIRDDA